MPDTVSLASAKAHLSELVSRVRREHDRVTVTVHGEPSAVLLSPDEVESLEETIAVLSNNELMRQIAASEAELSRGEAEDEVQLNEAMRVRRTSP